MFMLCTHTFKLLQQPSCVKLSVYFAVGSLLGRMHLDLEMMMLLLNSRSLYPFGAAIMLVGIPNDVEAAALEAWKTKE